MSGRPDLVGYSRGMYSNWLWHRPLQLLIDAGEGLQLALGPNVYAPSVLALTHGHSDHVLGLPGFVAARRFGKGAQDKPLVIVHLARATGQHCQHARRGDLPGDMKAIRRHLSVEVGGKPRPVAVDLVLS